MYEKLDEIERRYEELQRKIGEPSVATDVAAFREAMKSISEIGDVVAKYRKICRARYRQRVRKPAQICPCLSNAAVADRR